MRIADSWNFVNHLGSLDTAQPDDFNNAIEDGYFDAFLATVDLPRSVNSGVNVRVLPWVLPLVSHELIANQTGMGTVNLQTLVSAFNLRRMLGNDGVVMRVCTDGASPSAGRAAPDVRKRWVAPQGKISSTIRVALLVPRFLE
jgi:hypothetical protein